MLRSKRILLRLVLLLSFSQIVFAQNTTQKVGTGIISGKVTVAGKSVAGLLVTMKKTDGEDSQNNPGVNATTDANGIFTFDKLLAANYRVSVSAPGFYNPKKSGEWDDGGASVNLADGERVDTLEFALANGAVITGRLFDERGRAVIEENVVLKKLSKDGKAQIVNCNGQSDDRGVYRCYGLEPGNYLVGAGVDPRESSANLGEGNFYSRLWYPGVADVTQAKRIEVKTTEESTGIDIKLARRKKGYKVMGKVIEASSGKPLPGVMMGIAPLNDKGEFTGISFGQNSMSNAEGEFKIEGLTSGRYNLMYWKFGGTDSEFTAKSLTVEITNDDVTGIEMKMEKGATITAAVSLEAGGNPELQRKFLALNFVAYLQAAGAESGGFTSAPPTSNIDAMGNVHFKGLGTGKVSINVVGDNTQKGFSVTRIEHNGTTMNDGLSVSAGEAVTGVRIIVAYSSASIRGEIKVEGGTLPEDVNLDVRLIPTDNLSKTLFASADARGRFLFEGVTAGNYEIVVGTYANRPPYEKPSIKLQENSKSIQVSTGQEQTVTLTVRPGSKEGQ